MLTISVKFVGWDYTTNTTNMEGIKGANRYWTKCNQINNESHLMDAIQSK